MAEGIPEADIAAAVCYRPRNEFCVVQTKDGKRWTFPKGHRRKDETLPEAAGREALEEPGSKDRSMASACIPTAIPPPAKG